MYTSANLDQGSFASHAIWREAFLHLVPEGMSDEAAAPLVSLPTLPQSLCVCLAKTHAGPDMTPSTAMRRRDDLHRAQWRQAHRHSRHHGRRRARPHRDPIRVQNGMQSHRWIFVRNHFCAARRSSHSVSLNCNAGFSPLILRKILSISSPFNW